MPGRLPDPVLHLEPSAFRRLFFAIMALTEPADRGSGVSHNYKMLVLTIHMLVLTIWGAIGYT